MPKTWHNIFEVIEYIIKIFGCKFNRDSLTYRKRILLGNFLLVNPMKLIKITVPESIASELSDVPCSPCESEWIPIL